MKYVMSIRSSKAGRGRRRGRGRRKIDGGEVSNRSTDKELHMPEKDKLDGTRKYVALTCHQCKKRLTCKDELVFCSKCTKKRYCYDCIERWYPERTSEGVRDACPFCMKNCNCKDCLREPLSESQPRSERDPNVKLKQLQYLLVKVLPVLKDIYTEQNHELEIETTIRGVTVTESDITISKLDSEERIFCDLCGTSIANFHRSCPNRDCSCDICLSCCKELREDSYTPLDFSNWKLNSDSSIPCLPKDCGGCGTSTLELRRLFKTDWVEELITNAEEITQQFKPPDVDDECSSCSNFLYSPNAVDLTEDDIVHFQSHWMKAEPVIVRNVLENTSGLSWEPMVMWRACREFARKVECKEKVSTVKALDCLDWCEVEINIRRFFIGYLNGRSRYNGWPELFILKDWPLFEERLPRHNAEFIASKA